jgi:hypothetical protein
MAKFQVTAPDGSQFEITAPDTATDAEIQAYVQSQFAAPQQSTPSLPTEIPVTTPEIPTTPTFEQPKSLLQEQLAPERALSATIAGQLGGVKALTEAVDLATANPQLEQQLMQAQIQAGQKPTPLPKGTDIVGQTLGQVPVVGAELKKGFEFQAQTPAEKSLELLSGLTPIIPGKAANTVEDVAKVAKQRVQQYEAINDIATKVRGYAEVPPEFTVASDAVKAFAVQETKAAGLAKQPATSKLQKFYNDTGFKSEADVFGSADAKAAQETLNGTLQRRIDRQETELQNIEVMLKSPAISPEESAKAQVRFLDLTTKIGENKRLLNESLDSPAYQKLKEAQDFWGDQTMKLRTREVPIYKQSMSKQGVYIAPSEIEELSKPRPVTINPLQRLTMDQPRIMQMMDGNVPNGPMFELNIRPAVDAERTAINAVNQERSTFNQMTIDTGVAKASKERLAELFRVADGKLDPVEANITTDEQKFLNYIAGKYNDWITNINTSRAKLGYKTITPRKNYITHLQEAKMFDDFGLKDTALDGAKWGPKLKARFQFEKQRLTEKAIEDPIQAFDAYIEPAMRQIHTTEPAAVLQARAKFIQDPVLRKMQRNFIETRLLGGLDPKDRVLYEYGLGPVMQLSENLTGRFSSGVILGNAKVILQQFSQVGNTIKDTGLKHSLIGLGKALKEIPPEIASRSDFLTSRRISDDMIDIPKGIFYKPNQFFKKLFEFTDKFVAKQSWQAGFSKAQEQGLSPEWAIKYADDVARQLHGNYSKLYKTELNSGKVGRVIAPLQSFAFNLWNYIVQDTKLLAELNNTSRARELMKTFAAMYVTDEVYDAAGLPSPFGMRMPKALTPEELATSAREFVLGNVPFGRALEYGIPSPVLGQAVKEAQYFAGAGNKRDSMIFNTYALTSSILSDDLEKRAQATKDIAKFGVQFIPGGAQAYKTITGIQAAKDGFVEFGNKTVMLTPEDRKLAPILGPYAVPSIRKLRDEMQVEKFKNQFQVK